MKIAYTRAMVHAALDGSLLEVPAKIDPNFGVAVPTACPGIPAEILDPRSDLGRYESLRYASP